jgi:hypothetical protein
MPLSEQEQRLLDEMERSLYHNDADFVATAGARRGKPNYTWVVLGSLLAVAGIGGIVAGVATQLPVIGVIGFVVMFGGVLLALARPKASDDLDEPRASGKSHQRKSGFMDRMNERWDRRQSGGEH